ncbi:MAG: site-specific integrase [Aquabacterium sp.]|uniref:tyrosine-type recombinase/integrase n=1 Tax=Aquabacterium sp. TaxID=1872578 RepID=UPI001218A7F4|nr:site-specific integrase [Aquabacterium sp.]TAK82662.1 MAG: site-specific integrase [Aquabacterium sp.]
MQNPTIELQKMRLIFATNDLELHGRKYKGFPLILNRDLEPFEPVQNFLWHIILMSGSIESTKTWETYSKGLYDYFAFLDANEIDWKSKAGDGLPGPIEKYKEWAHGHLKLSASTVNSRIKLALRFYKWANQAGLIDHLPFETTTTRATNNHSFIVHTLEKPNEATTTKVLLKNTKKPLNLITKPQLALCLEKLENETHKLMLEMICRTGLRQEELRTFPEKYIFDPSKRKDIQEGQMIFINLDPRDMKTKGSKPRTIEIPYSLMDDLWSWSVRSRAIRANVTTINSTTLFLTETGNPYGDSAIDSILRRLSKKTGFRITAHMGRHTYATYRLRSLINSKTFEGDPLLYVMDRLGHSSVQTTSKYLKYINMLDGTLISQHEDELDELFH